MTRVEQNRLKRSGVGLRASDPELACPGYTLFAPSNGLGTVYLLDLAGDVAHTWSLPYPPGLYGYLTPAGTLFYNGKVLEDPGRFISKQPWKGGVALEVDWEGNVLWEVRHPDHHHDGIKLRNGNVLLICLTAIPRELTARVQGGVPGSEWQGEMHADYLVELTTAGEIVWEWRSWEHLDPERDLIIGRETLRDRWTHGNAVEELPDGNLLVSFRHLCSVMIVERATGRITWRLGPPTLAFQHAPTLLSNGNILIFDNGTSRPDSAVPYSRVIEVNPATNAIAWSYQERRPIDFFSPLISNAQRLPNGNTLICEGSFGRLFEVTPAGDTVWKYVNPHFHTPPENPAGPPGNNVFRAYRYSEEEIARARR
jgi:hypothetical protein